MDSQLNRKYNRVLQIISDVAECADGQLILVGGTALALFHLEHRISVDLDFVPVKQSPGEDEKLKQAVKGCLTKKGYRTMATRYPNQFVVQFDDMTIKIETFIPDEPLNGFIEKQVGMQSSRWQVLMKYSQ